MDPPRRPPRPDPKQARHFMGYPTGKYNNVFPPRATSQASAHANLRIPAEDDNGTDNNELVERLHGNYRVQGIGSKPGFLRGDLPSPVILHMQAAERQKNLIALIESPHVLRGANFDPLSTGSVEGETCNRQSAIMQEIREALSEDMVSKVESLEQDAWMFTGGSKSKG